jgi:protein TonB
MTEHLAGWIACRLLAMGNQQPHEREARLAGFFVVLAMHGAVLYSLWQYRVLPPPSETTTLFVDLLNEPPKPEPAKPPPPKPQPVKWVKPIEAPPPQQLVVQMPMASPLDPVAPPPPTSRIEAPVEPAPPPASAEPAASVALAGDLAMVCPERTPPTYPSLSRKLGEEGKAVLRVEVDESGQIDRASIITSSGYARLDEAALSAVKHWRCKPAQQEGAAVRAVALQPFNFVLEGR